MIAKESICFSHKTIFFNNYPDFTQIIKYPHAFIFFVREDMAEKVKMKRHYILYMRDYDLIRTCFLAGQVWEKVFCVSRKKQIQDVLMVLIWKE